MGQHLYTHNNPIPESDLDKIQRILESEGVIAYPTDVNWAFGCLASSPRAVEKLLRLKVTHPKEQPLALICDSISMASNYANIESTVYPFLKKALPGPFTVLLERNARLPKYINDKRRVVGIRIPHMDYLCAVIRRVDTPLATTSVPSLVVGEEVHPYHFGYEVFEKYGHGLDLLVDLGDELYGLETTVVDLTTGEPVLVRKGIGDPKLFGITE